MKRAGRIKEKRETRIGLLLSRNEALKRRTKTRNINSSFINELFQFEIRGNNNQKRSEKKRRIKNRIVSTFFKFGIFFFEQFIFLCVGKKNFLCPFLCCFWYVFPPLYYKWNSVEWFSVEFFFCLFCILSVCKTHEPCQQVFHFSFQSWPHDFYTVYLTEFGKFASQNIFIHLFFFFIKLNFFISQKRYF